MKILSNLDLRQNQLLQAVVEHLAAHPASPVKGQIYFNTTDEKFYGYTEKRQWVDLSNIYDDRAVQDKLKELESSINALEGKHNGLEARVTTAEGTIVEHTTAIEGIKNEIKDDIKPGIAANKQSIEDVSGRVTSLEDAKKISDQKIADLEKDLTAEVSRAKNEEARIEGLVSAEVARAKGEESKLDTAIKANTAAISDLESTLDSKIDAEVTRAKAEEKKLKEAIDGEIARATGEEAKIRTEFAQADTALKTALETAISKKADKTYVDAQLETKVNTSQLGNNAGQIPVLDDNGKLNMSTIPTLAINETKVVEDIKGALALNQKSGDIVVININSNQVKAITAKYAADKLNIARGYQVLEANELSDEYAEYLAEGMTTYICVNPNAEKFEDRYRPLNSIADTMTRGEIQRKLDDKDSVTSVDKKIQGAKEYADTQVNNAKSELNTAITNTVDSAKTELNNTINSTKTTLEGSISTLNKKVDDTKVETDGKITAIEQAASNLKAKVDAHVDNTDVHITVAERKAWNDKTDKKSFLIGNTSATTFDIIHNLDSEDVVVSVKEVASKEMVFTDVKVKDANTVVVSFSKAPAQDEFRVVVIG